MAKRKPKKLILGNRLYVRTDPELRAMITRAAKKAGNWSESQWVRKALRREVERVLHPE